MTINTSITEKPDCAALAQIHSGCFSKGWNAHDIAEMMAIPGTMAFVQEGGFGIVRLIAGEAELLTLAVESSKRGQGIGTTLVNTMRNWLKAKGAEAMFLEVRQSNDAAITLYKKTGFSKIASRKNYYSDADGTAEAAIVMRCNI